jgi:hypothetical protein
MFPYHQMFMMYPEELNDNFLFKFTYNPLKAAIRLLFCFLRGISTKAGKHGIIINKPSK